MTDLICQKALIKLADVYDKFNNKKYKYKNHFRKNPQFLQPCVQKLRKTKKYLKDPKERFCIKKTNLQKRMS